MIRNYIKTAWRNLIRNKLYSIINLVGLSVGIVGCLLIGLYIQNELSYDKFHKKEKRIARVTWILNFAGTTEETAMTGTKVGPEFKRQFPEVEDFVRLMKYPRVIKSADKLFEEKKFLYADSSFFKIFSFNLVKGNPEAALNDPNEIVLTSSMARKYFGSKSPINESITVGGEIFTITGVVADPPENSQIQFDFIGSFTSLKAAETEKWGEANYLTYLLLSDKSAFHDLEKKISRFMNVVKKKENFLGEGNSMDYNLQPISEVHLNSAIDGFEPNGSMDYLYILAAVAVLILLIACVNYTNMSIAQAAGRSTEIGMRKVLGAQKEDIFKQFISEAFLLTLFGAITGLFISYTFLSEFNDLAQKNLLPSVLYQPFTLMFISGLTLVIAFIAGAYPALVLSGGTLSAILKKEYTLRSSVFLRKTLIVFQFVISIFLIISTGIILQQLSYIQEKDLGYDKEHVLILPVDSRIRENYDQITSALENVQGVASVAGGYDEPTHIGWSDGLSSSENNRNITVNAFPTDENIVETLNLKIVAGKDFTTSDAKLADSEVQGDDVQYTYILNQSAVEAMGWTVDKAVGKRVAKGREGIVRGVVKDFHYKSLHEPIGPLVIFIDKRQIRNMFIKIGNQEVAATLKKIKEVWEERVSHRPFQYQFLDESYNALYKSEKSVAGIFTTFSLIAILLACSGLFALTAFSMARRTKEIGIRRVLGATVTDILTMVSSDFVKLVLLAVVIAVPFSFLAIDKWLRTFSYRVDIQWWIFFAASSTVLTIATVIVCIQAFKTILSNPVKNLRNE